MYIVGELIEKSTVLFINRWSDLSAKDRLKRKTTIQATETASDSQVHRRLTNKRNKKS